ncbi:MAG TPA: cytochrome c maturation protein CcmE, partial [Spirochaetota bacterium]
MESKNTVILVVVALAAMFAFKYMSRQMVPYVAFADAMKKGEYVQVIGSIDRAKGISTEKNGIRFTLVDPKGGTLSVIYEGEKPLNIEEAEKVVAIGNYDKESRHFKADKVLTKCPSKYENKR